MQNIYRQSSVKVVFCCKLNNTRVCDEHLWMSPVSTVFHTVVIVRLISKMSVTSLNKSGLNQSCSTYVIATNFHLLTKRGNASILNSPFTRLLLLELIRRTSQIKQLLCDNYLDRQFHQPFWKPEHVLKGSIKTRLLAV